MTTISSTSGTGPVPQRIGHDSACGTDDSNSDVLADAPGVRKQAYVPLRELTGLPYGASSPVDANSSDLKARHWK